MRSRRSAHPVVRISGCVKNYGALRPLRVGTLAIDAGEVVAIDGLDRAAAETLSNLIMGATLPDAGEVEVFGRSTRDVSGPGDWLALVDRIGLLSERGVLLEDLTIEQNLAVPFGLDLDPVPDMVAAAARRLAGEVELPERDLGLRLGLTSELTRLRVRLARSLALDPPLLVMEHPTAGLPPEHAAGFAERFRQIVLTRQAGALVVSGDRAFSRRVADRALVHRASTGDLLPSR